MWPDGMSGRAVPRRHKSMNVMSGWSVQYTASISSHASGSVVIVVCGLSLCVRASIPDFPVPLSVNHEVRFLASRESRVTFEQPKNTSVDGK